MSPSNIPSLRKEPCPLNCKEGIICQIESDGKPAAPGGAFDGLRALALYIALWGCLCSMASLSSTGVLPLAAGAVLTLALPFLRLRPILARRILAGSAAAAAVLFLIRWQVAADGVKLALNRMFAASEASQAYTYEMFSVAAEEGAWQGRIQYALLPLGLLTGGLCGWALSRRKKLPPALLFSALAGWMAYLGVSPMPRWTILLAAALTAAFVELPSQDGPARYLPCIGALAAFALVCGVVLLIVPDEDTHLSAWEERARDVLALHTLAYAENWHPDTQPEQEPPPEERDFEREETPSAPDGDEADWLRPLSVGLVIFLLALILFLPAILSDWLKRRRAKNRQGVDDPDNSAAVRAMFLYAMRWLRLGGLNLTNLPYSAYSAQIGERLSPELQALYETALPIWQEAAYSGHEVGGSQRAQMRGFMEQARQCVWDGLDRKGRFLAHYVQAL